MLGASRTIKYSAHRFRNKSGIVEVGGWRGRWSAASSREAQTSSPKKVSKDERRALLVSYVDKYRAEHLGKFPSVKDAIKNVGGGFYNIRIMMQQLQYKSKNQDEGAAKNFQNKSGQSDPFATQSDLLTGNGLEKANAEKMDEARGPHSDVATDIHEFQEEIEENFKNYHENANVKTEDLPKFVETESHLLKGESEKACPLSFGDADEKKEQRISEASLNSGAQPHKLSPEAVKNATDISSKQPDDAEQSKQSTMWGNLKFFVDGFIKMWRKS